MYSKKIVDGIILFLLLIGFMLGALTGVYFHHCRIIYGTTGTDYFIRLIRNEFSHHVFNRTAVSRSI